MPPPDELRRARLQRRQQTQGDPQWGAGGAATIADSASFGFGPEVLHFMTGVPEDEVRRDIDAFGEARPIASGAIEWGPMVAGLGGLVKGAGKAVFRSARRGLAGRLPARNSLGEVIDEVGRPARGAVNPSDVHTDQQGLTWIWEDGKWQNVGRTTVPTDPAVPRRLPDSEILHTARSPVSGLPSAEAKGAVRQELVQGMQKGERRITNLATVAASPVLAEIGYQGASDLFGDQSQKSRKAQRR